MLHQFMNQPNQMSQMSNTNNNSFGFGNSNDFPGSDNSQMMKMMLLKNQAMNNQNAIPMNTQNQQQPTNQNYPGNLNMMMNPNEKRKANFPHQQNNFQPPIFNQNPNLSNNQMSSQNHNNFFNFNNNNFPQNILKNMMNSKGMIPNNNDNKMKPDMMNFNMKKQMPQQMNSMSQNNNPPQNFNNRDIFPLMENMNKINNNEVDISKIKEKTKIDRNQKIEKYKNKKRNWKKKNFI